MMVAEASAPQEEAIPTLAPSATFVPTMAAIATAAAMPEVIALALPPTGTPLVVADASTPAVMTASTITRSTGPSPVLIIARVLQMGLLGVAGFEFVRRTRRGR